MVRNGGLERLICVAGEDVASILAMSHSCALLLVLDDFVVDGMMLLSEDSSY